MLGFALLIYWWSKTWEGFLADPWYQSGGIAFEVASWFIGVGEVKAGLSAAKGTQGFLAE